ncbi:MAG: hypothetical protein ACREMA_12735, partial [Longimicrobiales bacterium]
MNLFASHAKELGSGRGWALLVLAVVGLMISCEGSGVIQPAAELVSLTVEPSNLTLEIGRTTQFRTIGHFSGGVSRDVPASYAVTGGTITSAGLYTATVTGEFEVTAMISGGRTATGSIR